MVNYHKANHAIRLIYEGLGCIVTSIDWIDYEYMVYWRNDMMKWRKTMEEKYKWLKKG